MSVRQVISIIPLRQLSGMGNWSYAVMCETSNPKYPELGTATSFIDERTNFTDAEKLAKAFATEHGAGYVGLVQ